MTAMPPPPRHSSKSRSATKLIDFQGLIAALQEYWCSKGCLILQPFDGEVGAGTFHPATCLRAVGPEPWKCAYVQPVRRPADGRYGDNPNRLQHYYQFQVLLKPSPDNIQQLYIDSLQHVGIDPGLHDIRFVEDNWESPTLGAWGLGWEVWLDGMEVCQFTYFQQMGGIACSPVSGEITYGLERLAMHLQGCDNVFALKWNDSVSYGELHKRDEVEMSAYNFEHADTELLQSEFATCEKECKRLNEISLPLAAYTFMLRASHLFNLLDARGALSVTERQRFILRIRKLSSHTVGAWLESRQEQGFPLLGAESK